MQRAQSLRLAVFAPGLLGGSILRDARRLGIAELRVWARREAALDEVRAAGLADFTSTDAASVARGADLLILCMPVGGMRAAAEHIAAAAADLPAGAVVTDVGSVKGSVLESVGPVLHAAGIPFLGSHPMAGSHLTGLSAAREGLFQGAACLLTPREDTPLQALEKVRNFWQALGCRTSEMPPEEHDMAVARVSHMPHVAAAAVTLAALEARPDLIHLAAGGLRDTTRVASGDPGMWREILTENRTAALESLRALESSIADFRRALEAQDHAALEDLLARARALRGLRWNGEGS